jgi:acetoin utilization protein AcuB
MVRLPAAKKHGCRLTTLLMPHGPFRSFRAAHYRRFAMLSMNVPVDEFITPDPVTAREDMSIDEVRSLMDRHDIRHLPVMRGNAVVGLISERDVRLVSGLTVAEKLMVNASDIMTTVLLTVGASTPLVEVAHAMARQKVGSAIVNDEDGRLLGIFTATDALNALVEVIRGTGTRWTHTG